MTLPAFFRQTAGRLATVACMTAFAAVANAQAPADLHASAPTHVAVTIYRDNLALVTETRTVDLPGGPARVVFDGVLDRVIPQSAVVRGLDREKERNFDFDGLTPMSLLWRSIGATVTIVRTNPATGRTSEEQAQIAAAGDGVMLKFANRVEALGCSGLPEKLVFQRIPEGLRARPALSTSVGDAPAGRREITLSYLATGLEWKTDYVVTLNGDASRADIKAWVTLTNQGEEGFADAKVGVVAGDLSRVWAPETRNGLEHMAQRACWPSGTTSDFPEPPPPPPPPAPMPVAMAAPMMMRMAKVASEGIVVTGARVRREELADYQLYALNDETSVAAKQTKQVMFLTRPDVAVTRLLRYESQGETSDAVAATQVLLRTKNEEAKGLGEPLPRGAARVFAPASDRGALFVGEAQTRDTAVGLDWEIVAGQTYEVSVAEILVSDRTESLSGDRTRHLQERRLEIANATDGARTIEIVQPVPGASLKVSNSTARFVMKDGAPTWTLTLAPHARQTLAWRVRWID